MTQSTGPQFATCEPVGGLALVHYSARGIARRAVFRCPTCERRTPFVLQWDGAWYGTTMWCVACLDKFQDGDRMRRPFARYWKRDRAVVIRAKWDAAMLPDEYDRWTHLDVHRVTCNVGGWAGSDCPECNVDPRAEVSR